MRKYFLESPFTEIPYEEIPKYSDKRKLAFLCKISEALPQTSMSLGLDFYSAFLTHK